MARYTDSVCRICRREGEKLFFKGERCYTDKCAIERRSYPPGQHGQGRTKFSEYGTQLREKQKLRRLYGLLERQFRRTFHEAERRRGVTGTLLLQLLESRLDNVVYRLGFASSRPEARQLVLHGHVSVDGKKVNIPSYSLKAGQAISIREKSQKLDRVVQSVEGVVRRGLPGWLELDKEKLSGVFRSTPSREDIAMPINEQLIVELYSK